MSPTFRKNAAYPSALFLACRTLSHYNTWESWSGAPSSILSVLPIYAGYCYYGCSADAPYSHKKAMGCLVKRTRLNQAGSLELCVMCDGDPTPQADKPTKTG